MATLAAQLETDYTALVIDPHYTGTDLTRVAQLSAAWTKRYTGEVDGDDLAAVDLGLDYMTYLVMKRFQLITDDVAISELGRIRENALDLRMQRLQEQADPVLYDEDFD
jgi:hypothetical protein